MRFFGRSFARRSRTGVALAASLAVVSTTGCEFITGVPSVGYVEVTVSPPEFAAGTTAQARAVARKSGGGEITHNRRRPTLRTSDPAIATVSADGLVFGIAPGVTWVVAESDGKRDSAQVTVTRQIPARIDASPEFPTVAVNATQRVDVTPRAATGSAITDYVVSCAVQSAAVASVTLSGNACVLRGIAPGSTTLLITVNGVDKAVQVTVREATIARITAAIRDTIRVTEQVPIVVSLFGENDQPLATAGRPLAFSTSDPTIASVNSQTGVVTGVREGTATITVVTEGNLRTTVPVRVTRVPVVTVRVGPTNPQFRVGLPGGLAVIAFDSANRQITDLASRRITFRSLDESVLRVSPNSGVVTTVRIGTAPVIAQVDDVADTTTARVTEIPTARVVIDSNQVQRFPGGTFQYTATVYDSLNTIVTGRPIRWTSNSIAVEVNSATGLARAVGPGQATIQADVARVAGLPDVVVGQAVFVVRQTPAAKVVVAPASVSVRVGGQAFVGVTVLDAQGRIIFGREGAVRAIYDPAGIALVEPATGTIRGIAAGVTTVTLQALDQFGQPEGEPATLTVNVTRP